MGVFDNALSKRQPASAPSAPASTGGVFARSLGKRQASPAIQVLAQRDMSQDQIKTAPKSAFAQSPLGRLFEKLPSRISKPLVSSGEAVRKFISPPSVSDLMVEATNEPREEGQAPRTIAEVQERARELAPKYGATIDRQGQQIAIDPTGAIGSIKGKIGNLAREKSQGIIRNILRRDFPAITDDVAERIAPKLADEGTEDGIRNILRTEAPDVLKGADEKIERGFISSAKEELPKATRIAGQYIPRDTDELAQKAANLVKDDIQTAERLAMTASDEDAVATASELLKHYARQADAATDPATRTALYDRAADIANTIAPKLTEQGRAIQAASILGRLTPEGQLRFAAKEIMKWNELHPNRKVPELTGKQADEILTEMKAINSMADGEERAIRFKQLQDRIHSLVPSTMMEKAAAVWKAGLLTGLKTTGLNLFSNVAHTGLETAKDVPAAAADMLLSLITGKRTTTATFKGLPAGMKAGARRGWTYLKTGYDARDVGSMLDYKPINFKNKALQGYVDGVFRTIGSQDQPFYYGALKRSLHNQAKAVTKNEGLKGEAAKRRIAELVENPTDELTAYATLDAETAVFQQRTLLHEKVGKNLQRLGGGTGEFIVPFSKTPSGVAMQIINYSPAGPFIEIGKQIVRRKFDQRMLSQAIGRGAIGTGVLWTGSKLYDNDMVSLGYPPTERERELWKAEGRTPNSIKINGKWRSAQVLGPAGPILLMGAYYKKAFEESGSPGEAIITAVFGTLKSFTEQTFLKGVNQIMEVIADPQIWNVRSFAGSFISSWIPTIINDVARTLDPQERRTTSTSFKQEILNRVQSRIPVAREGLEPQVDILGRDRERVGNSLEVLLDPTRPSRDIETPVTKEFRRLWDAGHHVSPTVIGDRAGFDGLTDEQNSELWRTAGRIVDDKLGALFASPAYRALDDEQKAEKVEDFVAKSQTVARAAIVIELTQGLEGDALRKKLSELKETGLLTENVFSRYKEMR
jgi:hypothetical protein